MRDRCYIEESAMPYFAEFVQEPLRHREISSSEPFSKAVVDRLEAGDVARALAASISSVVGARDPAVARDFQRPVLSELA
jgi:hypothetical protein